MGAARRPAAPLHRAVSAGLHRGLPAGGICVELWLQLAKPGAPVLAPKSLLLHTMHSAGLLSVACRCPDATPPLCKQATLWTALIMASWEWTPRWTLSWCVGWCMAWLEQPSSLFVHSKERGAARVACKCS